MVNIANRLCHGIRIGMFGLFGRKKQVAASQHELSRDLKVLESQRALLLAATETADAANVVTNRLRSRLEDSVAQFENTSRIMNDALVICDVSGIIQAFNPAAEQLFAMTTDQVKENFIGDLIKIDNPPLTTASEMWDFLSKSNGTEHMVGIHSDGSTFNIDVSHTQLDRSDGSSIVLLVIRDLSQDHEATSYRSMFESSFDGILVVKGNDILAANPAASHLLGFSTDEILTKSLDGILLSQGRNISEGLAVGSISTKVTQLEVYFTTSTIWWNAEPASLVTIRDITSITGATTETPQMVCCFDRDFKITFTNHLFSSHYGLIPSDLIGVDIRDLMCSEERKLFQLHINGISPTEPSRKMQIRKMLEGVGSLQMWTDHAVYSNGVIVEFQRIGRDLSKTIKSSETEKPAS